MAQIIQAGWAPESRGNSDLLQAFGAVQQAGQNYLARRDTQKINEFNQLSAIAAKQFPDEQGGFTAALNSQDPAQKAAAEQFLGTYMDSLGRISGRQYRPEERLAIAGALANGMLSTRQLVNRAQGLVLLPEQQAGVEQGAQGPAGNQTVQAGVVVPAGTGMTGQIQGQVSQGQGPAPQQSQDLSGYIGAGDLGSVQNPTGAGSLILERMPNPGEVSRVAGLLGAGPLGEQQPSVGVAPQNRVNVAAEETAARRMGVTPEQMDQGVQNLRASAQQVQLAQQILSKEGPARATSEYQKAKARTAAGQATQIEQDYVAGYEALQAGKPKQPPMAPGAAPGSNGSGTSPQVPAPENTSERLRKALVGAPPEARGKALVGAFKVQANEAKMAADAVSEPTPAGRALDLGQAGKLELSKAELRSVERGVSGANKVMDAALEAKGPALGDKVASAERALAQTASLVPGAKLFSQAWARQVVETIRGASVEDLTAMGLTEEAKIYLDNDKNKLFAEQNDINLFTALSRVGADLTQMEFSRDIAKIQYAAAAATATGTAAGVEFAEKAKVFTELSAAARASAPDKKGLSGAAYRKFMTDSGFGEIADWAEGSFGGAGSVVNQARQGFFAPVQNLFLGSTEGVRPPSATEAGPFGATPAAELGMREAGLLGQPSGAGGTGSASQSTRSAIEGVFGNRASATQQYQNNVAQLYRDWQAMLAARGRR